MSKVQRKQGVGGLFRSVRWFERITTVPLKTLSEQALDIRVLILETDNFQGRAVSRHFN